MWALYAIIASSILMEKKLRLSDAKIKALQGRAKSYRVADGDGLYILVTKTGNKRWVFRYTFAEVERSISLGQYPFVTLLEARDKKHSTKKLIEKNVDPCSEKKREKLHVKFQDRNRFDQVAEEWFNNIKKSWCENYQHKVWHSLQKYVLPDLGNLPIADIKPLDVLRVVQRVERENGVYLSKRQLETCQRVFSYAVITGRIQFNPAIDLHRGLGRHRVKHHPTLRPSQVGEFLQVFRTLECGEVFKIAFELLLLTALRTCELRYSKWESIDWQNAEWEIPAELMKMRERHIVPLSVQSIALLRRLYELTGQQEWMFPSQYPLKNPVISENFATNIINKMGYKGQIVGHGFRSLFSTFCNECNINRDAVERQLAHRERNSSRAAYNRAEYLNQRRQILQLWADHLREESARQPPYSESPNNGNLNFAHRHSGRNILCRDHEARH